MTRAARGVLKTDMKKGGRFQLGRFSMRASRPIACFIVATLTAGGALSQANGELGPAKANGQIAGPQSSKAGSTGSAGLASSARGDNWVAANQFERARLGDDSPLNRFNLGAAYESTGRSADAAAQYRNVLADSRSSGITIKALDPRLKAFGSTINLAEEARRRLALIDARRGEAPAPEFIAGASASPFVGGPAHGQVTDRRAQQLDEAARSAGGE